MTTPTSSSTSRREFAEKQPQLVSVVLDQFKELTGWAKANPEESAKLLAKSSGVAYDALLKSEKRHVYEIHPITPEILGKQQTMGDAFHTLELIPQAIEPSEAYVALGNGS